LTPRRAAISASLLFVVTGLLWYATTLARLPSGFTARYFAGANQSNRPTVATVDPSVTSDIVRRNWPLPDQGLTAIWDGYLVLGRGGVRRFSVVSDGSSYLYIDDRLAINNAGPHGPRQVTLAMPLDRGVHKLRVEYAASDHPLGVDLLWAPSAFGSLTPLTGRSVAPANPSPSELTRRVWIGPLLMIVLMIIVVIVGTALDMTPTILILTPVLMPIVREAGIDPVYFGVLFIINNAIGLITPPVGVVLNVVCGVAKVSMDEIMRGVWPFMIAQLVVLALLTLFPSLVMVPAKWLGG